MRPSLCTKQVLSQADPSEGTVESWNDIPAMPLAATDACHQSHAYSTIIREWLEAQYQPSRLACLLVDLWSGSGVPFRLSS